METHRNTTGLPGPAWWQIPVLASCLPGAVRGDAPPPPETVGLFLSKFCYECHDADSAKGGLDLEALPMDLASGGEGMRRWTSIHDRLVSGEMPPEEADQPTAAERDEVRKELADRLTEADRAGREVVLRRLNRVEYEHTVRDLFGIEVFVKELLPQDASAHGFDTVGEALAFSSEQMQAYLDAAEAVLDAAFGPDGEPRRMAATLNLRDLIDESDGPKTVRIKEDGVVLFNSGYNPSVLRTLDTPGPGLYRVRIRARAVQSDRPVTMLVYGGVWGRRDKHVAGFFDVPPGETSTIEFIDRLWERGDTFEVYPFDTVHRQTDPDGYDGPGLFVGDVDVEGPIEVWPPPSRERLLAGVDPAKGTIEDARRILGELLPRAYRRPTGPEDVEPMLGLVAEALEAGKPFLQALRVGLKGVLCAPEFLFLEEPVVADAAVGSRFGDHALASRLSFFLWSSLPDDELFALAADGRLREPETLRRQVERMLADPRARRFTENFTGQWLKLREIDATLPDEKLYPDYDELLKRSMVEETHRFFQEVLDADLSVTCFVDADFAFLNERLARHYGIDGVTGQALRRVALPPDSVRGGVLTQAAVLKVTANGTTTSPVVRGAWILDNLVGRPSPPPPAGIPAVEPDIRGATTIREQLERHRADRSCARCHRHIDPPGFALENFDVIGGWRDRYRTLGGGEWIERDPRYPNRYVGYRRGPAVDPRSELPDGRPIRDIREYKRILSSDPEPLARCLAEKLLTYALGRGLGFSDRPAVEAIVAESRRSGFGFRTLVHQIVRSEAFQSP